MNKCKIWGTSKKKPELGMRVQEKHKSVNDLILLAYMKNTRHKKVFTNLETFMIVRGESPKWADLFINI